MILFASPIAVSMLFSIIPLICATWDMATVKFVGKLSTMGDKMIIVVPKEFHKQIHLLKGKQVKVVVKEAIS